MVLQEFCTTPKNYSLLLRPWSEGALDRLFGLVGSGLLSPPADCVHGGLDQHRMSTSHIHQFGIAVVADYSFNFDNPGKTHDACHLGIKGHYPVDDLPLALGRMIGSKAQRVANVAAGTSGAMAVQAKSLG